MMAFLLTLLFILPALADDYVEKLRELQTAQNIRLEKYKQEHPDWHRLPNDAYVEFYTQYLNTTLDEELELHDQFCQQGKLDCYSVEAVRAEKAKVRVAVGLVQAQNFLAKQEQHNQASRDRLLNMTKRLGDIHLCANFDRNCDALDDSARKIAQKQKAREDELRSLEEEFSKSHPDWKNNPADPAVKDFLVKLSQARHEKWLADMGTLCADPEEELMCPDEDMKKQFEVQNASTSCQSMRLRLVRAHVRPEVLIEAEEKIYADHETKWSELNPKKCELLLTQDLAALVPADAGGSTRSVASEDEANEDEKNPRNYQWNTCKWVQDMPRRVLYGPACGKTPSKICSGYVVCQQKEGGGLFVRQSTCGPEHCGPSDEDAQACTRQQSYWSKPAPDSKELVSKKLKRVLSGAKAE